MLLLFFYFDGFHLNCKNNINCFHHVKLWDNSTTFSSQFRQSKNIVMSSHLTVVSWPIFFICTAGSRQSAGGFCLKLNSLWSPVTSFLSACCFVSPVCWCRGRGERLTQFPVWQCAVVFTGADLHQPALPWHRSSTQLGLSLQQWRPPGTTRLVSISAFNVRSLVWDSSTNIASLTTCHSPVWRAQSSLQEFRLSMDHFNYWHWDQPMAHTTSNMNYIAFSPKSLKRWLNLNPFTES